MPGFWDNFKQNYDPQAVGIGLISGAGSNNTGQSIGQALLMGRNARLQEAQDAAEAAAADRKQRIDMADKGIYETPDGYGKRELVRDPTGGAYYVNRGPQGNMSYEQVYTPQQREKPEAGWREYKNPVDGQQGLYNEFTGEFKPIGAAKDSASGGGGGKGAGAGEAAMANEAMLQARQTRDLIADPERMSEQAGLINRFENWAGEPLGWETQAVIDKKVLKRATGKQVLEKIRYLAPVTETDLKVLQDMEQPSPSAGQKVWIDWWNNRAKVLQSILEKNGKLDLLQDPEIAMALSPIPMDGQGAGGGNVTKGGVKWSVVE